MPLGFEAPNDGTNRIFIIEQGGMIRIVQNGSMVVTPFLDITPIVTSGGETGLLGFAFHPSFRTNRRFFVDYTRTVGSQLQTVISEFTVPPQVPTKPTQQANGNCWSLISRSATTTAGNLRLGLTVFSISRLVMAGAVEIRWETVKIRMFIGKILRIGVDMPFAFGKQYAIPTDNPFASGGGAPEIFAYGLRNPWRFSFDRSGGQLMIGDVGQGNWEEVDIGMKGGNYGFRLAPRTL